MDFYRRERKDIAPGYEQKHFVLAGAKGLVLVANRDGRDGALTLHREVDVYAGRLAQGETVKRGLSAKRLGWLQVARDNITLNGLTLSTGDGAAVENETELSIRARTKAEVLLFDMTP